MLYIKKAEAIFNECFLWVGCFEKAKILASEFINKKIESAKEEYLKDFWKLSSQYLKSK